MDNRGELKLSDTRYSVGLALSGGGAKGFAHVGALRALEEAGILPDIISGVSAGSLVGALYADGHSPDEILDMFDGLAVHDLAELVLPRTGFMKIDRFRAFLKRNLRTQNIEDLQIPFCVTATDLDHGRSVTFTSGPIIERVCASCSMPVVMSPVLIDGIHYVDGGVMRNFPVKPIRNICNTVIGVNVSPMVTDNYKQSIIDIAFRSYYLQSKGNTFEDLGLCDVLIQTEEAIKYNVFDLEHTQAIAEVGYRATKEALDAQRKTLKGN